VRLCHDINMRVLVPIFICFAILPFQASAVGGKGTYIGINSFYSGHKSETNNPGSTSTETARFNNDINIGYVMPYGLYLGGTLMFETVRAGARQSRDGVGLSIGYLYKYWMFTANYYFLAELDLGTFPASRWTKGTGLEFNVGFLLDVSQTIKVGPQIMFRSIDYKNFSISSVENSSYSFRQVDTLPQLKFCVIF
jgi:hypothetical protein